MVREIEREGKSWGISIAAAARSLTGLLMRKAGRALTASAPALEQLEDRRLMFSLTVGQADIDPATGLGTVSASFAYAIPYFGPIANPQTTAGEFELIDFNDYGQNLIVNGQLSFSNFPVPNDIAAEAGGRYAFLESGLVFESSWDLDSNFLVAPADDARALAVSNPASGSTVGRFIKFSFTSLEGNPNALPVTVSQFAINVNQGWQNNQGFDVSDAEGMLSSEWEVEIEFGAFDPATRNNVTRRYGGLQFNQLFQGLNDGGNDRFDTGRILQVLSAADRANALEQSGIVSVKFIKVAEGINNSPNFTFDDAGVTGVGARFTPLVDPRIFGATIQLTGPVNARVEVFDLYGRDMVLTLLARPADGLLTQYALIDRNDDGRPDFNEGIGRINITGSDARTSFAIRGGQIEVTNTQPEQIPNISRDFRNQVISEFDGDSFHIMTQIEDLEGFNELFLDAGFGYERLPDGDLSGLSPSAASVIIGSPWLRNISGAPGNYGLNSDVNPLAFNFQNSNQGIFVDGNINRISANAILHGGSRIQGFVNEINVAYMVGSLRVDGDLGTAVFGADAGMYYRDQDSAPDVLDQRANLGVIRTGSQLVVGRTLGSLLVSGRNQMTVLVRADLDAPDFPARDFTVYNEKEFVAGDPSESATSFAQRITLDTGFPTEDIGGIARLSGVPFIWGAGTYRNDAISAAEFISTGVSGVRVRGELSGRDALNGEDAADVYSFAARKGQRISAQVAARSFAPLIRIVDHRGRTLAAANTTFGNLELLASAEVRWTPESDGIYYIVLTDPRGADGDATVTSYTMAVAGMVPVTFGEYRSGGGTGGPIAQKENSVTLLNGDLGLLRIGSSILGGDGAEVDPTDLTNIADDADDLLTVMGGAYTFRGSVYQIWTGSDIGLNQIGQLGERVRPVLLNIAGDLHQMYTGQSPLVGLNANEGDVNHMQLLVGGRIGEIKISGGIGMDQDAVDAPPVVNYSNHVKIATGRSGLGGDIGMLRLGSHMYGGSMELETPAGSTIGAFLISQDKYYDVPTNGQAGLYLGVDSLFRTGTGSDVLFFDVPRFDNRVEFRGINDPIPNTDELPELELTDDNGATLGLFLTGGVGTVRYVPMDGSLGYSIAEITVDLSGLVESTLRIRGSDLDTEGRRIGIGRITIVGASATSTISIEGTVEIDVYQIIQRGGAGLALIQNVTPGGDIVAIDVPALTELRIAGDLGSTFVSPAIGRMTGPFIGFGQGNGDEGDNPFTIPNQGLFDEDFNGNAYRPIADDNFGAGNAYLDDIGGPFDGRLGGIVVRSGDIGTVSVNGMMGDVICLGGNIVSILGNADRVTADGAFDGISGSIFAIDIIDIDVGDGLAPHEGPLARAGIFAADDITTVRSSITDGVVIRGVISASNSAPLAPGLERGAENPDGIFSMNFRNAIIIDSFMNVNVIDRFWQGNPQFDDDGFVAGWIDSINIQNSRFFRTRIDGDRIGGLVLQDADFDASEITMRRQIDRLNVRSIRNSTLDGEDLERRRNRIATAGNIGSITVLQDIQDLSIDVLGSITGAFTARSIARSEIEVDNEIRSFRLSQDLRGSELRAGRLRTFTVGRNIGNSTIQLSGDVTNIEAADSIFNSVIEVSGPSANLKSVKARNLLQGRITVSGPLGTVTVTNGSMDATIVTTTARGTVGTVSASQDLLLNTEISGTIGTLSAGRHIGRLGQVRVIQTNGNIGNVTAQAGQIYSDIRSGGSITGRISVAGGINKPGESNIGFGSIIAFGSINAVVATGDFGGDIISYSGGIRSVAITNGSLLPTSLIAAYDGTVGTVTITNGNLYGSVHADLDITSITVTADRAGIFGDIGVNPTLSTSTAVDATRNQLPANIAANSAINGPRITAGQHIGRLNVTAGDVFETFIWAGQQLKSLTIGGSVRNDGFTSGIGSVIAAGDSIVSATVNGSISDTAIIGGIVGFGNDGRLGGTGANADKVISGEVKAFAVTGNSTNVIVSAGMNAGVDGVYNTADDRQTPGTGCVKSFTVRGAVSSTSVFGDQLPATLDARFVSGGSNLPIFTEIGDPSDVPANRGTDFTVAKQFSTASGLVTFTISGPGQVFYNSTLNQVTVVGSTATTRLTMNFPTGSIFNNFDFVSSDDGAFGALVFNGDFSGDSDFIIDGVVQSMNFRSFSGTGRIRVGEALRAATIGTFAGGIIETRELTALTVTGDFGSPSKFVRGEAVVRAVNAGRITVNGVLRGDLNVERSITSVTLGRAEIATINAGMNIGSVVSGAFSESVLTAGDTIGAVRINGNLESSMILAGYNIGDDSAFDGSGANADALSSGSITSVTVTGSFRATSIGAGYAPGADGYLGTTDDQVAQGRSNIGPVGITGDVLGSSRGSEQYRIAASGVVTSFRKGVAAFVPSASGNLRVETPLLSPAALQVDTIDVDTTGRVFRARIKFNQPIDFSSIADGMNIREVRGTGESTVRLASGVDYFVQNIPASNEILVTFNSRITGADRPNQPGVPGPGIYRFEFDPVKLRARLSGMRLDGNGDGVATDGDRFTLDSVVGDAGDKIFASTVAGTDPIDFYAPVNLDVMLDNNLSQDRLVDTNQRFEINGFLGDHPDHITGTFDFTDDVDLYSITVQAGQILRIGALTGSAARATILVHAADGTPIDVLSADSLAQSLPIAVVNPTDISFPLVYVFKVTGTYYISVSNIDPAVDGDTFAEILTETDSPIVPRNFTGQSGIVGDYSFSVELFDDGNTGFNANTDAGDGDVVIDPPDFAEFTAGVTTIQQGDYRFSLDRGRDLVSTADDVVRGDNGDGIFVTRERNGTIRRSIISSIGPRGSSGLPGTVLPDADVFHLNDRNPIAPGTKMRATVKLVGTGSDLGGISATLGLDLDYRGSIQFAFFETTGSTDFDDVSLVFSPTDFAAAGGTPNLILADNGSERYGFDANGDYFIEFIVPESVVGTGAGSFALYIQGVYNTDYTIDIDTIGTGVRSTARQNILLEVDGGEIDWLEVGGFSTALPAFDATAIGFSGSVDGFQSIRDYIIAGTVERLNAVYRAAGVDVVFSSNAADFRYQQFSTVFLTSLIDPVSPMLNLPSGINARALEERFGVSNDILAQPFGFSERSDPLNIDQSDEAVVFIPPFAFLGLTSGNAGADDFIQTLSAAVGRRVGELVGLRVTENIDLQPTDIDGNPIPVVFDVMGANGPSAFLNVDEDDETYRFIFDRRSLSSSIDSVERTNFYFGQQNSGSLLRRNVRTI